MSHLMTSIAYYAEHEATIKGLLDELVDGLVPEDDDIPAFTFAALVEGMERDHSKSITVAALAVMRLAEIKRQAGEPS